MYGLEATWQYSYSVEVHEEMELIYLLGSLLFFLLSFFLSSLLSATESTCSKVRLQPKRIHRSKQQGRPRIGTARVSLPGPRERFAETMEKALEDCPTDSATARWNYIRDTMYEAASDAFGMRERKLLPPRTQVECLSHALP